jgi:hypothetical protein
VLRTYSLNATSNLTAIPPSGLLTPGPIAEANVIAPAGAELSIVVLEGDGAIHNSRQRLSREAIVQVQDRNRKPVAGATVVFTLPSQGAGGSFLNGSQTFIARTDSAGRAVARGFHANKNLGQFQMRVSASFQGHTAAAAIAQTNALVAGTVATGVGLGVAAKVAIALVVAGAATASGAVIATQSGGSSNPTPPPVSPSGRIGIGGAPSIGPPR